MGLVFIYELSGCGFESQLTTQKTTKSHKARVLQVFNKESLGYS